MSVSRVRHRGETPRDIDHGPANGAGGTSMLGAHAEVARLSTAEPSRLVEVGERLEGGAGAIERRQATEAQREAWRTPSAVASPIATVGPALSSRERMQQSRLRGGHRTRQLVAAARSPLIDLADSVVTTSEPSPPPEESVSEPIAALPAAEPSSDDAPAEAHPVATALWALRDAADEAAEALSVAVEAEGRWMAARSAVHASIRTLSDHDQRAVRLDRTLQALAVLREPSTPDVDPSTGDAEPAEVVATPDRVPAVVVPDREAAVFAEIVRAGSVMAAATALGLSDARVRQYVKRAKDEGRLPAEVAALIRSRA